MLQYKTEICRVSRLDSRPSLLPLTRLQTFWVSGSCPYGKRCCFIHTELPAAGAQNGGSPGEAAAAPVPEARQRSTSTNSDGQEQPTSLLARISAKRLEEQTAEPASAAPTTTPTFHFGRPATGTLRVDTASLDPSISNKQNKSAYAYTTNQGLAAVADSAVRPRSPPPATAGPDFGRQRLEVVSQLVSRTMGCCSRCFISLQPSQTAICVPIAGMRQPWALATKPISPFPPLTSRAERKRLAHRLHQLAMVIHERAVGANGVHLVVQSISRVETLFPRSRALLAMTRPLRHGPLTILPPVQAAG